MNKSEFNFYLAVTYLAVVFGIQTGLVLSMAIRFMYVR